MYDTVIVRYGEIFLKSDPVRRRFMDKLSGNLQHSLEKEGLDARLYQKRHRIYIKADDPGRVAERAARAFGVTSTSPSLESEVSGLNDAALRLAKAELSEGDTFAVRVNKMGDRSISGRAIESEVGDIIRVNCKAKVDLENPDVTVSIDVSGDTAYVYSKRIDGMGGLPVGTQGRVLALLHTDSDLTAALMMLRRGCSLVGVTDREENREKVRYYSDGSESFILKGSVGINKAERMASEQECDALVSGENARILESNLPVFQPLIGLNADGIRKWQSKFA
ncbi:MAG: THUMP domain-containing protein [Candidatus Altiarchaeota archaeon]